MAKKKHRKGKHLLPRRIGGIKVPKAVRKGKFGALIASPLGVALLAEVVAEMTGHGLMGKKPVRRLVQHPIKTVKGKGRDIAQGALAFAMGEAMKTFSDSLRNYRMQRDAERREQDELAAGETGDGTTVEGFAARRMDRPH